MYKFQDSAKQREWDRLTTADNHYFEVKVEINNETYNESQILELRTEWRTFREEQPSVGGCLSSELTAKIVASSEHIPRMAQVRPYARVTDGTDHSEWMPQGVYFIDTRAETANDDDLPILTIHCYDAMLKTEAEYPDTEGAWPKSDYAVVEQIADTIGVDIDERTAGVMVHGYDISPPISYTMREVLANIGAMYAGNWVMTLEGKLLLVTLNGIPEDTSILVNGFGDIITFGEYEGEELSISLVSTAV